MYKARFRSSTPTILLVMCCMLLAGCLGSGSKNVVRYYLVDPVPLEASGMGAERKLAIELIDLHIPQYLQRFQLVTRSGDNRLHFSDGNQWAGNLRKNLLRTLAKNLATRLATIDIGTPLNRSATFPDYRIHVHIDQFEQDSDGRVQLSARWQLSDAEEEDLGMYMASLQGDSKTDTGDYDQIVADMQELFGEFCDQIAASISALEGAG